VGLVFSIYSFASVAASPLLGRMVQLGYIKRRSLLLAGLLVVLQPTLCSPNHLQQGHAASDGMHALTHMGVTHCTCVHGATRGVADLQYICAYLLNLWLSAAMLQYRTLYRQ